MADRWMDAFTKSAGEGSKQTELILIQTLPLGKLAVAGKQLLPTPQWQALP